MSDAINFSRNPGQRLLVVGIATDERTSAQSFPLPEGELDDNAWEVILANARNCVHTMRTQLEPGWKPPEQPKKKEKPQGDAKPS